MRVPSKLQINQGYKVRPCFKKKNNFSKYSCVWGTCIFISVSVCISTLFHLRICSILRKDTFRQEIIYTYLSILYIIYWESQNVCRCQKRSLYIFKLCIISDVHFPTEIKINQKIAKV